ncbi:hypothetical protein [Flavobacterium sp. LAR06]|uniref:hypothetical protein n=1 Tax=Flavobacterium sp. LAR06 TaxID=3064897 RepID=UPI0035C00AAD
MKNGNEKLDCCYKHELISQKILDILNTKKEIIAKGYVVNTVLAIVVFTAIPFFIFYNFSSELLHWEKFNSNVLSTIVFFISIFIAFLTWINLFDNEPSLKINIKGIWTRKSILPFSPLKFLDWNQIKFVELSTIKGNKGGKTTVLVIHRNDSKTKTIDLDSLDYPTEEIIAIVREFSNFINYRDRMEVKQ